MQDCGEGGHLLDSWIRLLGYASDKSVQNSDTDRALLYAEKLFKRRQFSSGDSFQADNSARSLDLYVDLRLGYKLYCNARKCSPRRA